MLSAPATYLDFNSLAQLRTDAAQNTEGALDAAATQFEAQLIGMMLKSARDAKLADGLFDNTQTQQYLEMMDQQVALEMAQRGALGLRAMLVDQLGGDGASIAPTSSPRPIAAGRAAPPLTPEEFVKRFAPEAEVAAAELGIDPKLLLAQAALETGWGQSLPRSENGYASNNLFGIKATGNWDGPKVSRWTLEYRDGIAERRRESFRAYESTAESFADYVRLVRENHRYEGAVGAADDPEAYARGIVEGGYATDPEYLDKWLSIYRGESLNADTGDSRNDASGR